jgi:hypothetical protein
MDGVLPPPLQKTEGGWSQGGQAHLMSAIFSSPGNHQYAGVSIDYSGSQHRSQAMQINPYVCDPRPSNNFS